MAIGIGQLFGMKISENFSSPFKSKNIQEFWTRWHISFMTWLRDYVYYPFQVFIIKKFKFKNMFILNSLSSVLIFLIAGLWHGNKPQYVFYGLYHGLAFVIFLFWRNFIYKNFTKEFKIKYIDNKYADLISVFITVNYFVISLLFFTGKYVVFL